MIVRLALTRLAVPILLAACLTTAQARTLKVGPSGEYAVPSQAAQAAKDGDVVEIEAGDYPGDAAIWRAHGLTLRGVGGLANLRSGGATREGKAIWVIKGHDTTVEDIGFFDARVPDRNGAGIRQEGRNLTVRRCLFRDNENGILAGASPDSEILVEQSVFDRNGHGDGRSHNIYVGAVRRFTLRDSVSRRARIGHQVKSRAAESLILNNRLADEVTGNSSYLIDLPAGGVAVVVGNVLQQGVRAENFTMVAYGSEARLYENNALRVENNTFINDRQAGCRLLYVREGYPPARVAGNRFVGCTRIDGPVHEEADALQERSAMPPTITDSD